MASEPDADPGTSVEPAPGGLGGLRWLLPVAAVVIALDQITKVWAVAALDDGDRIDLFWTARFNLVRNEGSAFSLGSGLTPLIAIAAVVISIGILVVGRRVQSRRAAALLGVVGGGAVGNLIDRITRAEGFLDGAVIDFIDFQWWPVFNIADIAIVVGGIALVFWHGDLPEHLERKAAADASDDSDAADVRPSQTGTP